MSLPIEGVLFVQWMLESISKGEKVHLYTRPEVKEIYTQLILNQKPALTGILQDHIILDKSYGILDKLYCIIS